MAAGKHDILIEQGATFALSLKLSSNDAPLNLTSYIARMHIRTTFESPETQIELTTENGRISIDNITGIVQLKIAADDTRQLIPDRALYDLELESAEGDVMRVLQGAVKISPEVTR